MEKITKIMKNLFFALLMIVNKAIAGPGDTTNKNVMNSIKKEFTNAAVIDFDHAGEMVKAKFIYCDKVFFGFYSKGGELIALERNIVSDALPLPLLFSLKKNYGRYWISDLFEVSFNDHTSYYITLENSDRQMVLRSVNSDLWEIYSTKNNDDN